VEALHGAFKRRVRQRLKLRGSSDFDFVAAYEAWLHEIVRTVNRTRQHRIDEERAVMRPIRVKRLPEFSEVDVRIVTPQFNPAA
jgi:hypothetical protein